MTMRSFMDAGFALVVEEYQRQGKELISAVDAAEFAFSGEPPSRGEEAPEPPDNDKAIKQLQAMMAGISKG